MKPLVTLLKKSWLYIAVVAVGGLWRASRILPWDAASPSDVEAARKNLDRTDAKVASFVDAALDRTRLRVRYDGAYTSISYPGGDVPPEIGVCTDEVIRSYRAVGADLQQLVHEDMKKAFDVYPKLWGLTAPDSNIDHRRVPNLQVFLARKGAELPLTKNPGDYKPGDLVTSKTMAGRPHIAIVVPSPNSGGTPWIMHNYGFGPKMEDELFSWNLTGHYRWHPESKPASSP